MCECYQPLRSLQDPNNQNFEDLLATATRTHASYLTRTQTAPLLNARRIALFALNIPTLVESDLASDLPLALHIPLPSHHLAVGISSRTGLVEIEDDGSQDRGARAKLAMTAVNERKSRLLDDVGRLMTAVSFFYIFAQMLTASRSSRRIWKNKCAN